MSAEARRREMKGGGVGAKPRHRAARRRWCEWGWTADENLGGGPDVRCERFEHCGQASRARYIRVQQCPRRLGGGLRLRPGPATSTAPAPARARTRSFSKATTPSLLLLLSEDLGGWPTTKRKRRDRPTDQPTVRHASEGGENVLQGGPGVYWTRNEHR
ncbi:hypothetical protein OF83DRAFT_1081607 [Amylostereum chailletii]|nr:hypothetical protein OF83DRAFT_1081607 [Amylostereum chailletii]